MDKQMLVDAADNARKLSYSPYSGFKVGAALLCRDGSVYCGANIENSSFSATVCAERSAFIRAICDGEKEFKAMAIVGGNNDAITEFCPPCGVCRQFISEFCCPEFNIILFDGTSIKTLTLGELLPLAFSL